MINSLLTETSYLSSQRRLSSFNENNSLLKQSNQ